MQLSCVVEMYITIYKKCSNMVQDDGTNELTYVYDKHETVYAVYGSIFKIMFIIILACFNRVLIFLVES